MKDLLFAMLVVLVLGFGPAIAAAQGTSSGSGGTSGSSDKSGSSGSSSTMGGSSPGSSSTPSTTSPSASPSTSGGRSTDLSQVKSKTDCDKAGGEWEATTSTCQKAGK